MPVRFRMFKSHLQSWDSMFSEAAEFASRIGPTRLVSISHSEDQGKGVVTVWYWDGDAENGPRASSEELDELLEEGLRNIQS